MSRLQVIHLNGAEFIPNENVKVIFKGKHIAVVWLV